MCGDVDMVPRCCGLQRTSDSEVAFKGLSHSSEAGGFQAYPGGNAFHDPVHHAHSVLSCHLLPIETFNPWQLPCQLDVDLINHRQSARPASTGFGTSARHACTGDDDAPPFASERKLRSNGSLTPKSARPAPCVREGLRRRGPHARTHARACCPRHSCPRHRSVHEGCHDGLPPEVRSIARGNDREARAPP